MNRFFFTIVSALYAVALPAQQPATTPDTTTLLSAFRRGKTSGYFRYFFMNTRNEQALTDYHAHAAGGGIHFETASFHGFRFGVSGFYIFNMGSSGLNRPDSITGQYNRYEIGLFDMENPNNKKDINRLEELYLAYQFKKAKITLGRQLLNTPFVNLQDGRMRPTVTEGVWVETDALKKWKLEGGWIYAISPRSTTRWFSTGASIGVYATGVTVTGAKAQYNNQLSSKGIFMAGVHYNPGKQVHIQLWNMFTENIFNTAMLQADWQVPVKKNSRFFTGAQLTAQQAVHHGGHANPLNTYFEAGGRSLTISARAGIKSPANEYSISYTRITAAGRYLVPREWGREPFYTFMPRERNDGLGNVHAIVGRYSRSFLQKRFTVHTAAGYYHLPDVKDYRLNKYGMPAYLQLNTGAKYQFRKILNGLEAEWLLVYKQNRGETYNNPKFVFNKTNMLQANLVINYHF
ncbi:MAG: OprD family outer membrane porin [Dinghuibacter sp.]|nr:OprD family outer membrane porin [Dinghuibacter sp.]